MDAFSSIVFEAALTTQVFGRNRVVLPRTGSTNDIAKDLAAQGALEGLVVITDEQTTGRGRLNRPWVAPPSTCLLCSILFRPTLGLDQISRLTMLCSLAAADAVEQEAGIAVGIKWPNDLMIKSQDGKSRTKKPKAKKLAGVLTESSVRGDHVEFVVVGIGINVNVHPQDLFTLAPDATSILAEAGNVVSREILLAALLEKVEKRYAGLTAGENPLEEWSKRLVTLGQMVRVTTSTGILKGVAEGVDKGGALLLRTPNGALHRLLAGDVTLSE